MTTAITGLACALHALDLNAALPLLDALGEAGDWRARPLSRLVGRLCRELWVADVGREVLALTTNDEEYAHVRFVRKMDAVQDRFAEAIHDLFWAEMHEGGATGAIADAQRIVELADDDSEPEATP